MENTAGVKGDLLRPFYQTFYVTLTVLDLGGIHLTPP